MIITTLTRSPSRGCMGGHRRGFSIVEIMATMMLLTFGLLAILGLVRYATQLSSDYQSSIGALATAETVLLDPDPSSTGASSDWSITSGSRASGTFVIQGTHNEYFVVRSETAGDVIDDQHRWASITVHLYTSESGEYVTTIKRRMVRRLQEFL